MVRRPLRPSFSPTELPTLLDALERARKWSLKYGQAQTFSSDMRPKCDAVVKAVDELALSLTGQADYFAPGILPTDRGRGGL